MYDNLKNTRKLITRNIELEDEIKATRDGYEEEISVLLEKQEKLKKKLERAEEKLDQGENLHNDDSDAAFISNDADYEDDDDEEDMMESSTDQNFQPTTILDISIPNFFRLEFSEQFDVVHEIL